MVYRNQSIFPVLYIKRKFIQVLFRFQILNYNKTLPQNPSLHVDIIDHNLWQLSIDRISIHLHP